MELELTNQKPTKMLVCCIILGLAVLLCGCNTTNDSAPCAETSIWVCDDPRIVLDYTHYEDNSLVRSETLWWDDSTLEIEVGYRAHRYWVYVFDYDNWVDKTVFYGSWKYRRGKLVLKIEEDNLFGGQYKELVFTRQEIDSTELE